VATRFFGQYSAILRRPGALRFVVAGWFGRMARSTSGIATILLVSGVTSSYGLAGAVSAAIILGIGIGSPLWSRAMDRHGQSRVLPWGLGGTALSATSLALVVTLGAPLWTWFVGAFLVGATSIDTGSLVRARWTRILPSATDRHTALSLEAVNDELTFVVGPPLVTVLASVGGPLLGFSTGIGIALLGGLWLLAQRSTAAGPGPLSGASRRGLPRGVLTMLPVYLGVGVVFGSIDVGAVSVGRSTGDTSLAGVILALFSLGSVVSGFVFGPLTSRWSPGRRVGIVAVAYALVVPSLALVHNAAILTGIVAVAGLVTTPMLISGMSLIQSRVQPHRLTEAMGWPSVGLSAGVIAGSTIAGIAVDAGGAFSGFLISASGAAIVGVFGIVCAVLDRSRQPELAELQAA
jgi:MFS family permease